MEQGREDRICNFWQCDHWRCKILYSPRRWQEVNYKQSHRNPFQGRQWREADSSWSHSASLAPISRREVSFFCCRLLVPMQQRPCSVCPGVQGRQRLPSLSRSVQRAASWEQSQSCHGLPAYKGSCSAQPLSNSAHTSFLRELQTQTCMFLSFKDNSVLRHTCTIEFFFFWTLMHFSVKIYKTHKKFRFSELSVSLDLVLNFLQAHFHT